MNGLATEDGRQDGKRATLDNMTVSCVDCLRSFESARSYKKRCSSCLINHKRSNDYLYYQNHAEQIKANVRRHRQRPEYKKWQIEWNKKWDIANREKRRLIKRLAESRRRFHTRHVAFISIPDWESLKAKYQHRCPACLRVEPEIKLTIDHIQPISQGGSNDIINIQPLCLSCNSRKNANIHVTYPFFEDATVADLLSPMGFKLANLSY